MATILVIDDQEPIRTLLRAALEGDGHEVLEASNGLLGLERYRERAVGDQQGASVIFSTLSFVLSPSWG